MAAFSFVAQGPGTTINNLAGSGLAFTGSAGFSSSVQVGQFQGRTFITDSAGSIQGAEVNNTQYLNSQSGILGQTGSGINVLNIPNYQAPLNLRFTNNTAVQVQNAQIWAYDRANINNPPSGVTLAVSEVRHQSQLQTTTGSGNNTWTFPAGSAVILNLTNSPGTSGLSGGSDTEHDWYLCLSASPNSVGGKPFALYAYGEYF